MGERNIRGWRQTRKQDPTYGEKIDQIPEMVVQITYTYFLWFSHIIDKKS